MPGEEPDETTSVLDRVNSGELPILSATQTSPNVSSDILFGLSPNISMINRMQKSGKTFTEVYAEYVKMQGEIANKQRNIDHLQSSLSGVLAELEEAVCSQQLGVIVPTDSDLVSSSQSAKARNRTSAIGV